MYTYSYKLYLILKTCVIWTRKRDVTIPNIKLLIEIVSRKYGLSYVGHKLQKVHSRVVSKRTLLVDGKEIQGKENRKGEARATRSATARAVAVSNYCLQLAWVSRTVLDGSLLYLINLSD